MAIRMPTAAREPEWFCPRTFSEEVINFSFREIGELPEETARSFNSLPAEFRRVVETVGKVVFTLQSKIHYDLWDLFIKGIPVPDNVLEWERPHDEFLEFMQQGCLGSDIFNRFFSVLAIIGELSMFLKKCRLPAPRDLHHRPFCRIYEHSLKAEFLAEGGFDRLMQVAGIRYLHSGLYHEVASANYPNGVITENLTALLNLRNHVAPRNMNIAWSILREIYLEHEVVPLNPPGI